MAIITTECGVGGQYLVKDVVASLAGSNLDQPVQTLGGLLYQDIPAPSVVPLAPKTHHLQDKQSDDKVMGSNTSCVLGGRVRERGSVQTNLHLVHDGIRAQDVVFLLRVRLCVLYGPGGLSAGRQADHHQDLKQINKDFF